MQIKSTVMCVKYTLVELFCHTSCLCIKALSVLAAWSFDTQTTEDVVSDERIDEQILTFSSLDNLFFLLLLAGNQMDKYFSAIYYVTSQLSWATHFKQKYCSSLQASLS